MSATDQKATLSPQSSLTLLRLTVNNHPGVMLQICGLFARRGFNLEGIYCTAIGQGEASCIWLEVHTRDKIEQVVKQVAKLEDVLSVEERSDAWEQVTAMAAIMNRMV
jgi:acetolactate synthase-1/3 small subunit